MEEDALAFERSLAGKEQHLTGVLAGLIVGLVRHSCLDAGLRRIPDVAIRSVAIELVTDSRRFNLARRDADLLFRITQFDEADVIQRKFMHMNYALYGPVDMVPPQAGDGEGYSLVTMDSAFGTLPDVDWVRTHAAESACGVRQQQSRRTGQNVRGRSWACGPPLCARRQYGRHTSH